MTEHAVALVLRSDPKLTGNPTLAFLVAGKVLKEEVFAQKYTIVSVGGLTTWSSHTDQAGKAGEHLLVDQAVGLVLIDPRKIKKPQRATFGRR